MEREDSADSPQRRAGRLGHTDLLLQRPRVGDLVFQLYGRALHPELFEVHERQTVERGPYRAVISVTSTGHLVQWYYQGLTLTEVCTSTQNPLPQKRRLVSYRVRGQRCDRVECRGGAMYHMSFQLENVEPEVFWSFQAELAQDGRRQGLLHTYGGGRRMALGALSYVNVETRQHSLLVQSFHTFPDELAVVKSQSIFEIP